MKERGLIMSGASIPALLNTKPGVWPAEPIDPSKPFKWQTRRVIARQPPSRPQLYRDDRGSDWFVDGSTWCQKCRYGIAGDRLWMREGYKTLAYGRGFGVEIHYKADGYDPATNWPARAAHRQVLDPCPDRDDRWRPIEFGPWKSPLHIPRWASRALFELREVRAQQLGTISEEDAHAEGVEAIQDPAIAPFPSYRTGYLRRWHEIHGDTPLKTWVWALTLARIQ